MLAYTYFKKQFILKSYIITSSQQVESIGCFARPPMYGTHITNIYFTVINNYNNLLLLQIIGIIK